MHSFSATHAADLGGGLRRPEKPPRRSLLATRSDPYTEDVTSGKEQAALAPKGKRRATHWGIHRAFSRMVWTLEAQVVRSLMVLDGIEQR